MKTYAIKGLFPSTINAYAVSDVAPYIPKHPFLDFEFILYMFNIYEHLRNLEICC